MAAEKQWMEDECPARPLSTAFRKHNIPLKEELEALDGKIFAMLTESEKLVLDFFRKQGRKFGVSIRIETEADPELLAQAKCESQADDILKGANSRIHVVLKF